MGEQAKQVLCLFGFFIYKTCISLASLYGFGCWVGDYATTQHIYSRPQVCIGCASKFALIVMEVYFMPGHLAFCLGYTLGLHCRRGLFMFQVRGLLAEQQQAHKLYQRIDSDVNANRAALYF